MIPWLLEITLSNLLLAIPIALLASYIQSRKGMFVISHMLWAFVLIKLITPPIYSLPIIQSEMTFIAIEETEEVLATAHSSELSSTQEESQIAFHPLTAQIKNGLLSVWGLGSVLLFIFSIIQMRHFRRSLTIVNPHLEKEVWVKKITQLMGITKPLEVVEIDNAVTPLVWWTGGTPKIYISEKILKQLSQEQRQHVLAHELAHIKRGDHWLRWVEWFACLSMWWNPLVWHARKELRRNEELCCDYDAIQTLNIAAQSYAHTLVDVLEKLSIPESMTPRWVSTMAGTHSIERRIQMILSDQKPNEITGNLKRFIFALAISSLFIGFTEAQDPNARYTALEKQMKAAVEAGEMTAEDAEAKLIAARKDMFGERKGKIDDKKKLTDPETQRALRVRYAELDKKMKAAVEAGEMTAEDAEAKLIAARKEMFGERKGKLDDKKKPADPEAQRALRARYAKLENSLKLAVKAGEMTAEEAESKLTAARIKMFGDKSSKDTDQKDARLRARYEELQKVLREKVAAGEMTMEEMEKALANARNQMFGSGENNSQKARDRKVEENREMLLRRRFALLQDKLEIEVAEGRMTEKEASQMLEDALRKMTAEPKKAPVEKKAAPVLTERQQEQRAEYAKIELRVKTAVREGKMTQEEAEEALNEAKSRIFNKNKINESDQGQAEEAQRLRELRGRYSRLQKKLDGEVVAGRMTREEADQKLAEARKEMFGG